MKIHKLLASITLSAAAAIPALADFGPLISAADLDTALTGASPLVIDIRGGTIDGADQTLFQSGHIPGSVTAPYGLFRGPKDNPGELVSEEHLESVLQSLGITFDQQIVVVHQGKNETDFGAAARVYWTLKSSGLTELAILNGGVNAWTEAGLGLEQGDGASVTPSQIDITFSDQWLATTEQVTAIVEDGAEGYDLVDARPEDFWNGDKQHPAALKPGTLPQSRYFEQNRWFAQSDVRLIDADAIDDLLAEGGFNGDETLVSFCNTGHWAATNWFALSELGGLEDVKLYAGSMVEYSHSGGEMANTPGLFQNLVNAVTGN